MADEFFDVVVHGVQRESEQVVSLTLEHPLGAELPTWEPGSHVDVLLPNGILRQYSLCSDPEDPRLWRVAVLRELVGRGGSAFIHDELQPGTKLQVRAPRNNFPLSPAPRYLFIAGGIGITPILPMVRAAVKEGIPWHLLYLGRRRNAMAFVDEIHGLGDHVQIHASEESGRYALDDLTSRLGPGTAVYACGPATLLEALESAARGWNDPGSLHCEKFSQGTPEPGGAPNSAFVVELADGAEVPVPEDASILEALESAGINPLNSCREGICGTCETPVIAGDIDHRDTLLSPEEREEGATMMICVSRCRGARLVLDL